MTEKKQGEAAEKKRTREAWGEKREKPKHPVEVKAKNIVRLAGQDVDGSLTLQRALRKIRGVGHTIAAALAAGIEAKLSIPATAKIEDLSEQQLSEVEKSISKPWEYEVPVFLLNRQGDREEGLAKHLVGTSLMLAVKQDIDRQRNTRTWVGWRHSIGKKVRGQHTRTTGRTGITVGVLRKALKSKAAEEEKGRK